MSLKSFHINVFLPLTKISMVSRKILNKQKTKFQKLLINLRKRTRRLRVFISSLGDKIAGIGRGILNLTMSAFVFNITSSGFRAISKVIQTLLSQDEAFSNSLQNIKANLATAFYLIYQACLPALKYC